MPSLATSNTTNQSSSENGASSATNGSQTFQTYQDPIYGIKIQYPSTWTPSKTGLADRTNIVAFYSPLENITDIFSERVLLSVTPYSQNISLGDFGKLINATVRQPTDQILESNAITLKDGRPAYAIAFMSAPSALNNAVQIKPEVMFVWTVDGNKVYTISYAAEAANYYKYLPIVERMVESFEITK